MMPVDPIAVAAFLFSIRITGNATPRWESFSGCHEFIDSSYRHVYFDVEAEDGDANTKFTCVDQHSIGGAMT
jgi:hypothetical protein